MKKVVAFVIFLLLVSATATSFSEGASTTGIQSEDSGKTAFVSGYKKIIPGISGTFIRVEKADTSIKPPYQKTVAIAYYHVFTDNYGRYLYSTVNRVNEDKIVYGKDRRSGEISFSLPDIISRDIDMYWIGSYRLIIDKENNIVMPLAEMAVGDALKVTAYEVSGFALKDMTYLGAYRADRQTKLIVSDGFKVYVVDMETMNNEREYDSHGFKPVGVNLGLPLDKRDSRLGVWLVSRDNRTMYYMDMPSGEISVEADLTQFDINGEFIKLVSGWSGYITGGYGGVFLVKDNQNYLLYDSRFKRMVDKYPYSGRPLDEVKDIHWAIWHGVRTRAVVAVVEREGQYLKDDIVEAKEFYEMPANR